MPNFQDSYHYNEKSSSIEQLIKKGSEFLYRNSIDNANREIKLLEKNQTILLKGRSFMNSPIQGVFP